MKIRKGGVIRVTCEGAELVPITKLRNFQGGLKTLSNYQRAKLRNSILRHGFAFPVAVWKDSRGRIWIIDGHQRVFVTKGLIKEGYALEGGVPVAWVQAKTIQEAREKVLLAISQYGRYTVETFTDFVGVSGLDLKKLEDVVDLPSIDLQDLNSDVEKSKSIKERIIKRDEIDKVIKKWGVADGDIWLIPSKASKGRHHVIVCADASKAGVVAPYVKDVDVVVSDPPYDMDEAVIRSVVKSCADRAALMLGQPQNLHICQDGWKGKIELVWVHKTPRSKGAFATPVIYHQSIVLMNHGSSPLKWKRPRKDFGTVIRLDSEYDKSWQTHGHSKNPELFRLMMAGFTKAKIVCDPFLGAGATLIAAESSRRLLVGIEIYSDWMPSRSSAQRAQD